MDWQCCRPGESNQKTSRERTVSPEGEKTIQTITQTQFEHILLKMSQQTKIPKHMKTCVAKNVNKINNLNKNSTPA